MVNYAIYILWLAALIVTVQFVPFAFGILLAIVQTGIYYQSLPDKDNLANVAKVLIVLATINQLAFMFFAIFSYNIQILMPEIAIYDSIGTIMMCLWVPVSGIIFYKQMHRLRPL